MKYLFIGVGILSSLIGCVIAQQDQTYGIMFFVCGVILALLPFWKEPEQTVRKGASVLLDKPLFWWTTSKTDPCTLRDLLNSVQIFGRTGSGKTSSSGKAIAKALLNIKGSGGLVHAAKVDDVDMWRELARKAGREDDLCIFGPKHPWKFNLVDYEMKHGGGHTRNIVKILTTIGETLHNREDGARNTDPFWQENNERLLFTAVEILKQATGKVDAPELQRFISGAAMSEAQRNDPAWKDGFHAKLLIEGDKKGKTDIERHDWELAAQYWLQEFPTMADKTRSSILTGVMGILHTMNVGVVRRLFSTETNITPDALFEGKWILVNAPPATEGDVGSFVNGAVKIMVQRAILRRRVTDATAPVFIFADEFHQFVNSFDAHYLAMCRSHRGAMICLSQSLASYYAAFKGESGKHKAQALLANFVTKVFHAVDAETAKWSSEMCGRARQTYFGGSTQAPEHAYDELMMEGGKYSGSFSEHMDNIIEPGAFINGLRTGGPENDLICDAYIVRSGTLFSNGRPFIRTQFSQKG
jgi:type IV secretory pathway TraG/TraD family ATPase VirD4